MKLPMQTNTLHIANDYGQIDILLVSKYFDKEFDGQFDIKQEPDAFTALVIFIKTKHNINIFFIIYLFLFH